MTGRSFHKKSIGILGSSPNVLIDYLRIFRKRFIELRQNETDFNLNTTVIAHYKKL
jgi:hypothetical protein